MTATLGTNRYGKSRIRLVKVRRERDPHEIVDLTVDVQLEGAFDPMYTDGDNTACVATDTMKNTVYAFARGNRLDCIERFALRLAEHFLAQPAVARARVAIEEQPWSRLAAGGAPHPHAFMREGAGAWTAAVTRAPEKTEVVSGLADVVLLKTTDSAFAGFPRDRFTTLAETADRILATSMTASWTYASVDSDFGARERIRAALLETFAAHQSRSVQHTLYAMGEAALAASDAISDVTLTLPNRHHLLVDLRPFGLDNPNEVFVATDEPYGLIHATVRRT